MSIRPEKFEDYWQYKYVTFDDGSVLFCDATSTCDSHKKLVIEMQEKNPAVKAVSAGQVKVREKRWVLKDGGSTTANLPALATDEEVVGKVLEKYGFIYDEELWYT